MAETGESVSVGLTGLGKRALNDGTILDNLLRLDGVTLPAVCDLGEKNREIASAIIEDRTGRSPTSYANHGELVQHDDLDAVVITTPWHLHLPMAITAMRAGLDCATEVGPANSVEECQKLVSVAEETGQSHMMLENYCFGKPQLTMCHMARSGVLGDIVHARAGYSHDLRDQIAKGRQWSEDAGADREILEYVDAGSDTRGVDTDDGAGHMSTHFKNRNGDLYPTHGLVPVAKAMDINRGNRIVSLTSTASMSRGVSEWTTENLPEDHPNYDTEWACGDVITTVLTCAGGETITLTYDVSLPETPGHHGRGQIRGTAGACDVGHNWVALEDGTERDSFEDYYDEYVHPLWESYESAGVKGRHGGSDYITLQTFVEAVRRDKTPPIDVYDAATFRAIAPLTERSIALGNDAVPVPDFTDGRWMTNDRIFGRTNDSDRIVSTADLF
jgi:predicted dehydrogenase